MIKEQQFRVTPQVAYNEQNIIEYISREMGIDRRTVTHVHILKKSIDARQKQIYINLTLRIFINEEPADEEYVKTEYPDVSKAPQVIVVGAGPCGLFAALKLIELGLKPIILERGKDVRERKKDLALIKSQQSVDPESNYCFGEGGAGAYSDGKLKETRQHREDTECLLPVRGEHQHSLRRSPTHRNRQAAPRNREYEETDSGIRRRGTLPNKDDRTADKRR